MEKEAEQHILTKFSKGNTFQVIRDLLHEFMNLNALKITLKIHKKITETDPIFMLKMSMIDISKLHILYLLIFLINNITLYSQILVVIEVYKL